MRLNECNCNMMRDYLFCEPIDLYYFELISLIGIGIGDSAI